MLGSVFSSDLCIYVLDRQLSLQLEVVRLTMLVHLPVQLYHCLLNAEALQQLYLARRLADDEEAF